MINLVILGTGNLATHLIKTFLKAKNVRLVQVFNHHSDSLEPFRPFTSTTTDIQKLKKADVYLLALKDDVIEEVALKLSEKGGLIAHTSGSVSMDVLNTFENHGVFYPLQSFSKNRPVDFEEIPVCLEANSVDNLKILKKLALGISDNVLEINSKQRRNLHLAAVFINNFTNHFYSLGSELCRENGLSFELLKPLIKETASKIETLSPIDAQTGPALRNDIKTINSHLKMLGPEQQQIYKLLTHSIQNLHGKKL